MGDFNQRIPRQWASKSVYEAPIRRFKGFEVAAERNLDGAPRLAIDHIAHAPDLGSKGIGRRKLLWPAVMPIFVGHWAKQ